MTNATTTTQDLAIVPVGSVAVGTKLICDDGFTCLKDHAVVEVKEDDEGDLYVPCAEGEHGLDGQVDDAGENYVGFWLAGEPN